MDQPLKKIKALKGIVLLLLLKLTKHGTALFQKKTKTTSKVVSMALKRHLAYED